MPRRRVRCDYSKIHKIRIGKWEYLENPVMDHDISFEETYQRSSYGKKKVKKFENVKRLKLALSEFTPMNIRMHGTIPMLKNRFNIEKGFKNIFQIFGIFYDAVFMTSVRFSGLGLHKIIRHMRLRVLLF